MSGEALVVVGNIPVDQQESQGREGLKPGGSGLGSGPEASRACSAAAAKKKKITKQYKEGEEFIPCSLGGWRSKVKALTEVPSS